MNNNGNILINQIIADGSSFYFKELVPLCVHDDHSQLLTKNKDNIFWSSIDLSINILVNNKFKDTDIYYDHGRLGIGRNPLFNYVVDLAVPKNTRMTAFHVGDGSFGFSMGNGTGSGFLPEIIGIGSNEIDAGLCFIGVAGNNLESNIPLIKLDGRNTYGQKLSNRPIVGITSGNYYEYVLLIDSSGNININGNVNTNDVILNGISLLDMIEELRKEIKYLKTKII